MVKAEMGNQYLTCVLGEGGYGLLIRDVREIIQMTEITSVPEIPEMKGVINLRGKVIPVISLRERFGMTEINYDKRTCIIVVEVGEKFFGLIVDAVSEVVGFADEQIDPPPTIIGDGRRLISGIARAKEGVKILLDLSALLRVAVEPVNA